MFENANSVIFVVDLLCFDYVDCENNSVWREVLWLFEEIANSR